MWTSVSWDSNYWEWSNNRQLLARTRQPFNECHTCRHKSVWRASNYSNLPNISAERTAYTNDAVVSTRTLAKCRIPFRLIPSLFSHLRNIVLSEAQCTRELKIIYRLNLGSYNSFLFVRFFIVYCLVFQWFRFHFQAENERSCSNSRSLSLLTTITFSKRLPLLLFDHFADIGLTNRLCSTGAAFIRFWPLSIPDNKMRLNWVRNSLVGSMCFVFISFKLRMYRLALQAPIIIGKLFEFLLVQ